MTKNIIKFKKARFTLLSDVSFKAEYSLNGVFINKELFVTDLKNTKPLKYSIKKSKDRIVIQTKRLIINYQEKPRGFSRNNFIVLYKYKNKFKKWYFGKKDRKNLGGTTLDMFKYPKERGKKLSQGVISKNGYFTYYDHTFTFWDKKKEWAYFKKRDNYRIVFFIGYGKDYSLGLKEYSQIFGKALLPPLWAFGFWYSRYWNYHQNEFIKLVNKYRLLNIPIDVMVIDTDWRRDIWRGYEWSKKYFPYPEKFIKTMKKSGIKLVLNDHPGYNESEFLPEHEKYFKQVKQFLKKEINNKWRPDWSNKKEVEAFCNLLLAPKLKQGIDFWWIDGWGADGLNRDKEFFNKNKHADKMGLGVAGYYGLNPQLWLNHHYYQITKKTLKKRPLLLTRWGGFGSERYPVNFSGDTFSTWKTLAYQVYFTYTAGNVLANYWSHDLGGFLGKKISKELFIRWVQFGAFSSIMRTHSDHGIREPWKFDKQTLNIFKKYIRIRYRLIPYFYQCAYSSYKDGMPLIRALYHNYPEYKKSYRFKEQFMIGEDILVAPIVKKMKGKRFIKKKIFFPDGEWFGIENGYLTMGPSNTCLSVPLDIIPFFIRKNSIIPVNQDIMYIGEKKNNYLQFEIFSPYNAFLNYYEDDGITDDYQKGRFLIIPVKITRKHKKIILKICKQKGYYKSIVKMRKITVVVHFTEDIKIKKAISSKKNYRIYKTDKVFNEVRSYFNSYRISFNYNGKDKTIIFDYEI